ncbi:acyltransferase [Paludibacterium yongneupense]|uniref:acyltransferase n=1 Tax=Paludibacterium yongneupense TaxID=400061 RepID=UPI00048CDB89|nr:acyltransferase [Paludibacterium yongneupense]
MKFSGVIDEARFLVALESSLQSFDFLFSTLRERSGNIHAEYRGGEADSHVGLERSTQGAIENTAALLPQTIDSRVLHPDGSVDGLPMLYLKLTHFPGGFAIGYFFNHAFIDQSSLVYFFKSLARHYNEAADGLPEPVLVDTLSLLEDGDKCDCNCRDDFLAQGEQLGFLCRPLSCADDHDARNVRPAQGCDLQFDAAAITVLRNNAASPVSSNDIINAVLLKIHAEDRSLNYSRLEMACDMRHAIGLDDSTIGNIIASITTGEMASADIRKMTVLDLAIAIRRLVARRGRSNLSRILNWYRQLEQHTDNADRVVHRIQSDPSIVLTSNWSQFDYPAIRFGRDSMLEALEHPHAAMAPYLGIITFGTAGGRVNPHLSVTLPLDLLATARQLGQENALFHLAAACDGMPDGT